MEERKISGYRTCKTHGWVSLGIDFEKPMSCNDPECGGCVMFNNAIKEEAKTGFNISKEDIDRYVTLGNFWPKLQDEPPLKRPLTKEDIREAMKLLWDSKEEYFGQ